MNDTDGYWQKVQFETLQAWTDYQQELSTAYPTWYATRNERMISNEEQILQEIRSSDASLLIYYAVDGILKVLKSNGESFQMIPLEVPASWADSVIAYRSITELNQNPRCIAGLGYYLNQILWSPVKKDLKERVIILPDGVLHKLNFETLLSSPPASSNYSDWPWSLKKHNILLRNSLTASPADRKKNTTGILALVPGFSDEVKAKLYADSGVDDERKLAFGNFVQTPF